MKINQTYKELILGRLEYNFAEKEVVNSLKDYRILITGGQGSIGAAVAKKLRQNEVTVLTTDILEMDVTDYGQVDQTVKSFLPTHIIHLAADKHAPDSEVNPEKTILANIVGTLNVVKTAQQIGAKVITSSTCKACDPETVYGSSKLICERLTLNTGGSVARFYNVIETSGNVFTIWGSKKNKEILVTPCYRYFITLNEAVFLLLATLHKSNFDPGRYSILPGRLQYMPNVASRLYPDHKITLIPPRRGDRVKEPLTSMSEKTINIENHLIKITSSYDGFL